MRNLTITKKLYIGPFYDMIIIVLVYFLESDSITLAALISYSQVRALNAHNFFQI